MNKRIFRNPKKTNWSEYSKWIDNNLPSPPCENLIDTDSIDVAIDFLTKKLVKPYMKFCPISREKNKANPPWWNSDLKQKRTVVRKLHRKAIKSGMDSDWSAYRSTLNSYTTDVRKSKENSWHQFCESINDTNEAARLRKVISKDKTVIGSLQKHDNSWTETGAESLQVLMSTHFPGCQDFMDNDPSSHDQCSQTLDSGNTCSADLSTIFSESKIEWAINSFKPYKSPGPDGIIPAMLQNSSKKITPWLTIIFKRCLVRRYIPKNWRDVNVVFIPKAGKPSHSTAKDFRPISLSSFFLKTMERLLDLHLRDKLSSQLNASQHAYLKGKSVETALHDVVSIIERNLYYREFTLASFLDIEGAFNNVETASIRNALEKAGAEGAIVDWIDNMLKSRIINSEMAGDAVKKTVTRGTPQGGVISPLLWLLVVDQVLESMKAKGFKVVAYADDVVILISGKHLPTITNLMESALLHLSKWSKQNGLGVNPAKTELVLFTKKRKIQDFTPPKMDGQELTLSSEAKYLGTILDSKLSWKRNTEERMKKGFNAFYACKKAFGTKWGMQPHIIHWMYTAIIRPIITYGAIVWWKATETKSYLGNLEKVQRIACMGITGAARSTPQAALEVLLSLPPLETYIKSIAARSAIRLKETLNWKQRTGYHTEIFNVFKSVSYKATTDYTSPQTIFDDTFSIEIPSRQDWECNSVVNTQHITIYTDGSKTEKGTGAGFYCESLQTEKSFRLPNDCSIFQAELFAIQKALEHINFRHIPNSRITVFVDSQAAIKALDSKVIKSTTVAKCRDEVRKAATHHQINICWVPGHCNVTGNEKADALARKGSDMNATEAEGLELPIGKLIANLKEETIDLVNSSWKSRNDCRISRHLWPAIDTKRTADLLKLCKNDIRMLIGVLTGHCKVGYMISKYDRSIQDFCRSCGNEEELETIKHLMCDCPALSQRRLLHLGKPFFDELSDLAEIGLKELLGFIRSTKWF